MEPAQSLITPAWLGYIHQLASALPALAAAAAALLAAGLLKR